MNALSVIADRKKNNKELSLKRVIRKTVKTHLNDLAKNQSLDVNQFQVKLVKMNTSTLFNLDRVSTLIAQRHDVTVDSMKSSSRKREVVDARQEAMFVLWKSNVGHSQKKIGNYFGDRDHSTVNHSIHAIHNRMDTVTGYSSELRDIFKSLNPKFNFISKGLAYLIE